MADLEVAIKMGAGSGFEETMGVLKTEMRNMSKQFGPVGGSTRLTESFKSLEDLNRALDSVKQMAGQTGASTSPVSVAYNAKTKEYDASMDVRQRRPNEQMVSAIDKVRTSLTGMIPGGNIVNAFETGGKFVGIAAGVIAIASFMKSIVQSSQIFRTMVGTVMKTLGMAVDLMLAPLMPIITKFVVWFIQHIFPLASDIGNFLSKTGGVGVATAGVAGIMGYVGLKVLGGKLLTMGTDIGAGLLKSWFGGTPGVSVGKGMANAFSGVVTRGAGGIGKLIGGAVGGAVTITKTALTGFGTLIGRGLGAAIPGMGGKFGMAVGAALGGVAIVALIGAGIGYAIHKRLKQLEAEDNLFEGMSRQEQVRFLENQGLSRSLALDYQGKAEAYRGTGKDMGSSIDILENFKVMASTMEAVQMFGEGFRVEDLKVDTMKAWKEIPEAAKDWFVNTYLAEGLGEGSEAIVKAAASEMGRFYQQTQKEYETANIATGEASLLMKKNMGQNISTSEGWDARGDRNLQLTLGQMAAGEYNLWEGGDEDWRINTAIGKSAIGDMSLRERNLENISLLQRQTEGAFGTSGQQGVYAVQRGNRMAFYINPNVELPQDVADAIQKLVEGNSQFMMGETTAAQLGMQGHSQVFTGP